MPDLDLGILNVLIAMVIVILVLSLVVQSMQTLVKKVFKLKSRSILNSLEDLFETIIDRPAAAGTSVPATQSKTPKELVADVTERFKEMGRKSLFGQPMLDSLAKNDLLKVLTRVKATDLLPGAVENFQTVLAGIQELKREVGEIQTNLLKGEASSRFAAMQGSIMPVLHDVEALASGGKFDSAVFFGDLTRLRQIKPAEVLTILGEVQQAVSKDLATEKAASDEAKKSLAAAQQANDQAKIESAQARDNEQTGKVKALESLDAGLRAIANRIASLSNAFDAAFAPLFARLQQAEVWYDTVMHGFEERYTRHMRTVGIVLSIGVVVVLNANFFSVYRSIKSDPAKTALIAQQAPEILKLAEEERARQSAGVNNPSPTPTATPTPTPRTSPSPASNASTSPSPSPSVPASSPAVPSATASPVTVADVKKEAQRVEDLSKIYESFGMRPLSRQQIKDVWAGNWQWRDVTETVLGWMIMVMLLSAGAPFWQDTLESLFGLKNLLRQKSDTKNIEEGKGGQPKP